MEGGEAWRWDPISIASGVSGIRRVLAHIGMVDADLTMTAGLEPLESRKTSWARARRSGILQVYVPLGASVVEGDLIGEIFDSFGNRLGGVRAQLSGVLIGRSESPLVNRGDAVAHVASIIDPDITIPMVRPASARPSPTSPRVRTKPEETTTPSAQELPPKGSRLLIDAVSDGE